MILDVIHRVVKNNHSHTIFIVICVISVSADEFYLFTQLLWV